MSRARGIYTPTYVHWGTCSVQLKLLLAFMALTMGTTKSGAHCSIALLQCIDIPDIQINMSKHMYTTYTQTQNTYMCKYTYHQTYTHINVQTYTTTQTYIHIPYCSRHVLCITCDTCCDHQACTHTCTSTDLHNNAWYTKQLIFPVPLPSLGKVKKNWHSNLSVCVSVCEHASVYVSMWTCMWACTWVCKVCVLGVCCMCVCVNEVCVL